MFVYSEIMIPQAPLASLGKIIQNSLTSQPELCPNFVLLKLSVRFRFLKTGIVYRGIRKGVPIGRFLKLPRELAREGKK